MKADDLKTVAVLGSGQMGSGIAQVFATAGLDVTLFDKSTEQLERGSQGIQRSLEKLGQKGRLQEAPDTIFNRIRTATGLDQLASAQFVVEAVVEAEAVKTELFSALNRIIADEAIFASNTSSLSITRMGSSSGRPDRFVGMHFMNPAPVMKLVEVVVGLGSSTETVTFVQELADRLGKSHVRAEDYPGFIVNRILLPMINESVYALQDAVGSPEDIDKAMTMGTNQPMGPLALADLIGLDTVLAIMEVMQNTFGDDKYRPAPLLRRYVDAGYLGRKVGRGFYSYGEHRVKT